VWRRAYARRWHRDADKSASDSFRACSVHAFELLRVSSDVLSCRTSSRQRSATESTDTHLYTATMSRHAQTPITPIT
jgi:hypothetical protein